MPHVDFCIYIYIYIWGRDINRKNTLILLKATSKRVLNFRNPDIEFRIIECKVLGVGPINYQSRAVWVCYVRYIYIYEREL